MSEAEPSGRTETETSQETENETETSQNTETETEFVELNDFPDYEISTTEPYVIRRSADELLMKQTLNKKSGYYQITLNGLTSRMHRLIAKQFLLNPNNLRCLDHINRIKTDNRLDNLCWCTNKQNSNNLLKHEIIPILPKDSVAVKKYLENEFNDLYYSKSENKFFVSNAHGFRVVKSTTHHYQGKQYDYIRISNTQNKKVIVKPCKIIDEIFKKPVETEEEKSKENEKPKEMERSKTSSPSGEEKAKEKLIFNSIRGRKRRTNASNRWKYIDFCFRYDIIKELEGKTRKEALESCLEKFQKETGIEISKQFANRIIGFGLQQMKVGDEIKYQFENSETSVEKFVEHPF
jgi:hypothetical protein